MCGRRNVVFEVNLWRNKKVELKIIAAYKFFQMISAEIGVEKTSDHIEQCAALVFALQTELVTNCFGVGMGCECMPQDEQERSVNSYALQVFHCDEGIILVYIKKVLFSVEAK